MVEPHSIVPEKELNRLEEVERSFNQLKKDYADLEDKHKNHSCNHEHCERRYNKLNDRFERILFHKNKVDGHQEEEGEEEEEEEKSDVEEPSEKVQDDSSEKMREPLNKKKKNVTNKSKKHPWYYIGDLSD